MPVHISKVEEKQVHPRSIEGFCRRNGICRGTFYNKGKLGLMPDVLRIGARITITEEAEAEWKRRQTVSLVAA